MLSNSLISLEGRKNCILQMSEVKWVKLSIFPKDLLLLSDISEIHSSIFGSISVSGRSVSLISSAGIEHSITRQEEDISMKVSEILESRLWDTEITLTLPRSPPPPAPTALVI